MTGLVELTRLLGLDPWALFARLICSNWQFVERNFTHMQVFGDELLEQTTKIILIEPEL